MKMPEQFSHLVINTLPNGEALVFDPRSQKAHALDAVTALVLSHCDGQSLRSQVVEQLKALDPGQAADLLAVSLDHLIEQGLINGSPAGMSRRAFLDKWGMAAVAVPLVAAVTAPLPAAAASGGSSCPPCGTGTCCGTCAPCSPGGGPVVDCCDGTPVSGTATTVAALLGLVAVRAYLSRPRAEESDEKPAADPL